MIIKELSKHGLSLKKIKIVINRIHESLFQEINWWDPEKEWVKYSRVFLIICNTTSDDNERIKVTSEWRLDTEKYKPDGMSPQQLEDISKARDIIKLDMSDNSNAIVIDVTDLAKAIITS
jgi:hypothetical protein